MRLAREKITHTGCYYHLFNRTAGFIGDYPLDEVDREFGMKLIRKLSEYYLLEFISMCWMGNHFHIILYAPSVDELPENAIIAERHNAYYDYHIQKMIDPGDSKACHRTGLNMIDISRFMKDFQQRYVYYYNRNHNRRGHFWQDRFKSTILEGREALWSAALYVELNPVRSGLVNNPADYRHNTWGWAAGSGKHHFYTGFTKHLRRALGDFGRKMSDNDIFDRFRSELNRIMEKERKEKHAKALIANAEKLPKESMPLKFLRRTRHWTDGGIIGSKAFIREVACHFREKSTVMKKQLSRGKTAAGQSLYCFKRLRQSF